LVLEQVEQLPTQEENTGSRKDGLQEQVAEQEKKICRLEKRDLEQAKQLLTQRENMSSRTDVLKERIAEQEKKYLD